MSSFATSINDRGQIMGVSLNAVPDPFTILGLGDATTLTQTRGFLWDHGEMATSRISTNSSSAILMAEQGGWSVYFLGMVVHWLFRSEKSSRFLLFSPLGPACFLSSTNLRNRTCRHLPCLRSCRTVFPTLQFGPASTLCGSNSRTPCSRHCAFSKSF
jgi:hypothetical protein